MQHFFAFSCFTLKASPFYARDRNPMQRFFLASIHNCSDHSFARDRLLKSWYNPISRASRRTGSARRSLPRNLHCTHRDVIFYPFFSCELNNLLYHRKYHSVTQNLFVPLHFIRNPFIINQQLKERRTYYEYQPTDLGRARCK